MSWLRRLFGSRLSAVEQQRAAARKLVWRAVHAGQGIEIVRAHSATHSAACDLVERVRACFGCDSAIVRVSDDPEDWEIAVRWHGRSETTVVTAPRPDWGWAEKYRFDETLLSGLNAPLGTYDRRLWLADVATNEDDDRGVILYITLDAARALQADGAFLGPRPPSEEDLAEISE
jgi:hypothetical protein